MLLYVTKVFAGVLPQATGQHRGAVLRSKFVASRGRQLAFLNLLLYSVQLWHGSLSADVHNIVNFFYGFALLRRIGCHPGEGLYYFWLLGAPALHITEDHNGF